MTHEPDRDLAQRFQEERAADARHSPAFSRVLRGRTIPTRRVPAWPVFAMSAALVAVIVFARLTSEPELPFAIRAGELRVPTDYLLDIATFPRAGDIPPIGDVNWFPLSGTDVTPETRRQQ